MEGNDKMRTIYGIESESKKLETLKKTIGEARNCFGGREFTRKDYKTRISYWLLTLDTLKNKGLVKIVRKERFEVKLDGPVIKECLINNKGKVVQTKYSYSYRERMLAEELGFKVEVREFENEVVEGIRYFYKIDFDKFEEYIAERVKHLKKDVNSRISQAKNTLNLLRDLETKLDY